MLNILMSEIRLNGASIHPFVGQIKPSGMPQHMRMNWEGDPGILTGTIIGGILIMHGEHLVAGCLVALSTVGWLSSRMIPAATPSST